MRKNGAKYRRVSRFNALIVFTLFVFALILFLLSPLFNITSIEVTGNSVVSFDAIKAVSGIEEGMNIFSVGSSKIANKLSAVSYIKKAHVSKIYPGILKIDITERKVSGYVDYKKMNTYILIDADGTVLETKTYLTDKLPIIVGLNCQSFVIGEVLETENKQSFRTAVSLTKLFEKYEFDNVAKIDVTDVNNIHLYVNNTDILFGDMEDADVKIQQIKVVCDTIPEGTRCFLERIDAQEYLFTYLK